MMLFDTIIQLDNKMNVKKVIWDNESLSDLYADIWDKYVGHDITGIFNDFSAVEPSGTCVWENNSFNYDLVRSNASTTLLYLKQKSEREYLMARALDLIDEGIQIYDRNSAVVYINKTSRRISSIPDSMPLQGKHLLDIYNLDEKISTTITVLRTGAPVLDRVDHFYSNDGAFIATANSGYPITRNDQIIGAVTFDQTKDVVANHIARMKRTEEALTTFNNRKPTAFQLTGYTFNDIIGSEPIIKEAVKLAKRIAPQECNVLLLGDTGTGKEMFAQSIHKTSRRKSNRFLAINCAAVPEELIEGLLFGTNKGGFTGSEDRAGYFEEANGGTIFLDELNSMSLSMQSKLLRTLQEGQVRRVGGKKDIAVNVRIISSCNEDPFKAITENRLRKDLFYRLSTVMIELPTLKDHINDLDELIWKHIESNNVGFVNNIEKISPDVMELFRNYSWPGNVRELFHVIDYAMNLTDGNILKMESLPKYMLKDRRPSSITAPPNSVAVYNDETLQQSMNEFEESTIRKALDHFGGNITQTAKALDIKRQSLQYRIKKYGIVI